MKNFAIFISGRGSNLNALLQAYEKGNLLARPALVICNKKSAPGLTYAENHNVPTEIISTRNSRKFAENCTIFCQNIDFIVLAGFMRIIPPELIEKFPNRIINIHPSLLPAFSGLHAQKQALDYGVRVSGCTTHFVTAKVDAGPIILQKVVKVQQEDTEESLADRILEWEHKIIVQTVNLMAIDALTIEGRRVIIDFEKIKKKEIL